MFGLLAWSLSVGYFPRVLPDVPVMTHWVTSLVAALLFFVSVFLHELLVTAYPTDAIKEGIRVWPS
jgi:hypothetical protein